MMICPICEKSIVFYSHGKFHFEGKIVTSQIYYCTNCNSFLRKLEEDINPLFINKLAVVYTDPKNEQEHYNQRIGFYSYIYSLTKAHKNSIKNWLDYGCSYGHFIAMLNRKEILSYGIEVSHFVDIVNSKGQNIYKRLEDLPQKMKFDVISFIDSFYYSLTPKILLRKTFDLLEDDGLLVMRIVNRNWLIKFDKNIIRKENCTALIDHLIGYSKKSISYLLENNGFEISEIVFFEKGKYRSKRDSFLYSISVFLYKISNGLINHLPGIILIARKNPKNVKSQIGIID
jgi:SAM-dependent methyltransferase